MSGRQDSNLRPPGPKPGAITGLRYAPNDNPIKERLIQYYLHRMLRTSVVVFVGVQMYYYFLFCKQIQSIL